MSLKWPTQQVPESQASPSEITGLSTPKSEPQQGHYSPSRRDQPPLMRLRSDPAKGVTLSFRNFSQHGDLFVRYLEARKSIFIDTLHWNVPNTDGMEFDQYDTPFGRYFIVHDFGEILGGVRLLPTTAYNGCYSYMLRDAQNGLLPDLPTDILFFKAPVAPHIWEASRFFITGAVSASRRLDIQKLLFDGMARTAKQSGASLIIGIVPAIWARWARRLDVSATPVGAKFSIAGTSSQAVHFQTH